MQKRFLLFIIILLSSFAFAEEDVYLDSSFELRAPYKIIPKVNSIQEEGEFFDLKAATEHVLDKRQNYFLTSTDYKITPKVNPITGEYCEEELDLVVAGCQPLSVRRFYNSSSPYDPRYATWRYNPEAFFVANIEWQQQEIFAAIGEFDGSVCSLKRANPSTFNFQPTKGFAISGSDGTSHPLNTKINYWKQGDPKDKHRFEYHGTITDGSGRSRSFASAMHRWTHYVHWREKKGNWLGGSEKLWRIHANTWTPFHIPVTEEKLPNGNILVYTYTQWKKEKQNFPLPKLLSSITAYNADKTQILGSINFRYPRAKYDEVAGIQITGSDGRTAFIQHHIGKKSPIKLASATRPGVPHTSYSSHDTALNTITKPDGRTLITEYNSQGKVSAQYAPVGPNGETNPIGRYEYQDNLTIFYDAENNRTHYRYDADKKLTSIETFQGNTLYRIDRFTWDPTTGNLTRKTIEDQTGAPIQITEYQYDKNQNPIIEKEGDGKEWRTITRTFSDDGFNLKLSETDREGKLTRYKYIPNTNLLSSEFVYENDAIRQRTFHSYDDCAICIKTIIDNGHSEDPNNLQGVTYRKITQITPKQTQPCFGLPEVVEEKTIDPSGNEILLHKVIYTYAPFGKVLKEDHYDAEGTYRYSLHNAYDDKERLISQTNQLGHTTSFTYDANNNLTSISGPKPGQHQEIVYDKANRPIRIADWQTDGTILITEKKYDKSGKVVETTDPCKNITRFEYDALGRLITTIHPDGAVERKEYDPQDNVIKEIDPEGHETHKSYNCFGEVTEISYPDGSRESFTYNPTGTLASQIDKNGARKDYSYDCFDHPIKTEIYSSSNQLLKTTSAIWTPFQKISETDGELTTTYTYDFAGRKIDEQKDVHKIHYVYDNLSRIRTAQEGDTEIVEEHDLADQVIETRKEKSAVLQSQEAYVYDENGNCTQVINSQGITETHFDTDDNPLSITDPLGFSTRFIYSYGDVFTQTSINPKGIQTLSIHDSRGREASCLKKNPQSEVIQQYENVYDKNGNRIALLHTIFSGITPIKTITHRWEYGPMGRIERFIESGERETRYLYDDKGRLKTMIKPNGCSLLHEYDDLGRLSRFYAGDFDYHYTYDQNDHVTSVHDKVSNTTTIRSYDPLGNILEERLANGLIFTNRYDNMGRRIGLTLPDSSCIDYIYDGHYLYQIKRGSYTHTYSERNLEGQIVKAHLPNAQEISIERDKLGRYACYCSPHFTASYPQNAYDGNGNLLCYQSQDPLGKAEYTFSYDDLDQLIAESDHAYQFDSLYNRLKKNESDYTIDAFCQVNCDGNATYEYDACGNLISDGVCKYSYDSLDRLIAIDNGSTRVEYTYDPFNRRLSKTLVGWFSNTYIRYMWDGDNEIGTVDEKNRIQELRVLGEGLGAEIGASVLYELNGKSYIPIHDHRGCIVTLVDLYTKKPIESYRYTAFGEELTQNKLSPWRFASKRVDEETGLVFFGRRYYHPELGRWITQDPEGFEDGPNLYAYLKNCPLADFDPYGLWSWGGMWGGTKEAFGGAGSYLWDGACGLGRCAYGVGELGYAGLQSAYYRDTSYFRNEWSQSWQTLSNVGRSIWNDPLGAMVPGVMEAWRNPTSPAAWGKAAVDIGLIGFSAAKIGSAARLGRVGRIGEEFTAFGKAEIASVERMLINPPKIAEKITGYTHHGINQAIGRDFGRGVRGQAILDAVKNPKKIVPQANGAMKYVGKEATVVLNSKGQVITTFGKPRGPQVWNESGVVQPPKRVK